MRYRLLAPHVTSDGRMLEEGAIVGEGDDVVDPWRNTRGELMPPTTQMEGLDDDSRKAVGELHQKLYGAPPSWENNLPEEQRKAREAEAEEQAKLDAGSKPVSRAQAVERKIAEQEKEFEGNDLDLRDRPIPPGPARQPSSTATASPTRGGVTRPAAGPATPQPPSAEDARPKKPNEDQYPKG